MENIHITLKKEVFNDAYLPYLDNEDRYLVFYGGRIISARVILLLNFTYIDA